VERVVPAFARDYPDDPELTALVDAFEAGNYRRVRAEAPALAAKTSDEKVRAAARELRARTEADPLARWLLFLTLALLLGLSAFWLGRDRPTSPKPPPTIERIPDSFGR
jgi:hypothetical protein